MGGHCTILSFMCFQIKEKVQLGGQSECVQSLNGLDTIGGGVWGEMCV